MRKFLFPRIHGPDHDLTFPLNVFPVFGFSNCQEISSGVRPEVGYHCFPFPKMGKLGATKHSKLWLLKMEKQGNVVS